MGANLPRAVLLRRHVLCNLFLYLVAHAPALFFALGVKPLHSPTFMPPKKPTKKASKSKGSSSKEVEGGKRDGNQAKKYSVGEKKSRSERAAAAIVSYNAIDILDPPKTLVFGVWNDRKTTSAGVNGLYHDFLYKDFTPGEYDSMIRLMVNRSHIVDGCINADMGQGVTAPTLELTGDAKNITVFGGRHRLAAVRKIVDELKEEKGRLSAQLKNLKELDAEEIAKDQEVLDEIGQCEKRVLFLTKEIKRFSTWGVIVYDAGKYLSTFDRKK